MNVREMMISKLDQLPDALVQEVNEFVDFMIYKNRLEIIENKSEPKFAEKWSKWFKDVEELKVNPHQPIANYSELLINKYRQQGLDI